MNLPSQNKFELLKKIQKSRSQWVAIKKEFKGRLVSPLALFGAFSIGIAIPLLSARRSPQESEHAHEEENNLFLWWMTGLIVEYFFKKLLRR